MELPIARAATNYVSNWSQKLREKPSVRSPIMWCRSLGRRPEKSTDRLISVMYHDVPAHARASFAEHLSYMRSLGDFVTPKQAIELLDRSEPMGGRYFCVTFDDGELSAYQNAFPVLTEQEIPAAFFIVPSWVSSPDGSVGFDRKYVTWGECRQMADHGIEIGSHSLTHRRFTTLDVEQAEDEMVLSKLRLERELNRECEHFACPWGQPGHDYLTERDPQLAAKSGYRSFFTTIRGSARRGVSTWAIPRIRLEPDWGTYQLRYLFSR